MSKSKVILFYIASFTWGILMSAIGGIVVLALLITGHKPQRFHDRIYFQVGGNWGGAEIGCFFIVGNPTSLHIKQHESGHGFQNCWWGPLMPFVVCIPSAIRYWLRECKTKKIKYIYSSILSLILLILGVGLIIPGCIFTLIPLIVVGNLIVLYFICIFSWLFFIELPKYGDSGNVGKDGKYVEYDSIWFEGQATRLGAKVYPEDSK